MTSLRPIYTLQVFLDGDDDSQIQTENFSHHLLRSLEQLKEQSYCREYKLLSPDVVSIENPVK